MKDIFYAGFAQLSYLNWHNLEIQEKLYSVFEENTLFKQIKTPAYDKWNAGENYCREIQDGKRIYDAADSRIF